jgi:ABC-type branched-subunit amino acid transport system ATPase component
VRQVLVKAVQQSPPDDDGRTTFLQSLFDVTDEKRGEFALQKFREIKTEDVRSTTAAQIAKLQAKRK